MVKYISLIICMICLLSPSAFALPEWKCLDKGYPFYDRSYNILMVYDEARGRVVHLVNGALWEWDGMTWSPIPTENEPPDSYDTRLVYDRSRSTCVLWVNSQVWELQGSHWVKRESQTSPSERHFPLIFYDTKRNVTHLMGGYAGPYNEHLSDHWTWDGNDWRLEDKVTTGPFSYDTPYISDAAFDEKRGVLIIMDYDDYLHKYKIWEWDSSTWNLRTIEINRPAPSYFHYIPIYNPMEEKVCLFPYGNAWDGENFIIRFDPNLPQLSDEIGGCFDRMHNRLVYLVGNNFFGQETTWEWDGEFWRMVFPVQSVLPYGKLFYDAIHSEMLFIGYNGEVYSFEDRQWTPKFCTQKPQDMRYNTMTSDYNTSGIILFTKTTKNYPVIEYETWHWTGKDWYQDSPTTYPVFQYGGQLAYDFARKVPLLIGEKYSCNGNDCEVSFEQWIWDGHDWKQEFPEIIPTLGRWGIVSDSLRKTIHLLAFYVQEISGNPQMYYEHWLWDGHVWKRTPDKSFEFPRDIYFQIGSLYIDPVTNQIHMIDLGVSNKFQTEHWVWDDTELKIIKEYPFNIFSFNPNMAFDPRRNLTLIGEPYRDSFLLTFELTSDTKRLIHPDSKWTMAPVYNLFHDSIYNSLYIMVDIAHQEFTFGCDYYIPAMWQWQDGRWKWLWDKSDVPYPTNLSVNFDCCLNEWVGFGGEKCPGEVMYPDNRTWLWNGDIWKEIYPKESPPPRYYTAMTYDARRHKMIIFGGKVEFENANHNEIRYFTNDTWAWNGETWSEEHPTSSPQERWGHVMAYDENRSEIVLYGGEDETGYPLYDTWTYNGSTWRQRFPAHPPDFFPAAMIFNRARCRVTLFGANTDKILEWNGEDWVPLNIPNTPIFANSQFVYDRSQNAIIVYHAKGKPWFPSSPDNSLWVLDFSPKNGVDAERIISHILGLVPFKEDELPYADVNRDGIIDVADMIFLANEK